MSEFEESNQIKLPKQSTTSLKIFIEGETPCMSYLDTQMIQGMNQINGNPLKQADTVKWLRKRFKRKAQLTYINTPEQLDRIKAIEMLFHNFDDNNSGTLEVEEMYQMFNQFGFEVSVDDMKKLFSIVQLQKDGNMDIDEFKEFMMDEKVTLEFKKIMKKLKKYEKVKSEGDRKVYIPMNFNSMLNYLHNSMQHSELRNHFIGVPKAISSKPNLMKDMDQFVKLFAFDRLPVEKIIHKDPILSSRSHNQGISSYRGLDSFRQEVKITNLLQGKPDHNYYETEQSQTPYEKISTNIVSNSQSKHQSQKSHHLTMYNSHHNSNMLQIPITKLTKNAFDKKYSVNTHQQSNSLLKDQSSIQKTSSLIDLQTLDSKDGIHQHSIYQSNNKPQESRAYQNLKHFITGYTRPQKSLFQNKNQPKHNALRPYLSPDSVKILKSSSNSILCQDQKNSQKINEILEQTSTFQVRPARKTKPQIIIASSSVREFNKSSVLSQQPANKRFLERFQKDQLSPLQKVYQQKKHLFTFKEVMQLPAYEVQNKLKMRMIKNSMDINLQEIKDIAQLSLFNTNQTPHSHQQQLFSQQPPDQLLTTQSSQFFGNEISPKASDESKNQQAQKKDAKFLRKNSSLTSLSKIPNNLFTMKKAVKNGEQSKYQYLRPLLRQPEQSQQPQKKSMSPPTSQGKIPEFSIYNGKVKLIY